MAELGKTDAGEAKALPLKASHFGSVRNSQTMAAFKNQMKSAVMQLKLLPEQGHFALPKQLHVANLEPDVLLMPTL